MKSLLLSIRPEFVERIFDGTKTFEFRKSRCKQDVDTILIYCTCPVKKIVGVAHIKSVIVDSPEAVWSRTCDRSGITKEFFDQYYGDRDQAVAYELEDVEWFDDGKVL